MSEMAGKLLTLTPLALEALALEWYMRGFRESGKNFHGQSRVVNSKAILTLLRVEFRRQWAQRKKSQ